MQSSAKKQERMMYADPNDHSFNYERRFVDRKTHEFGMNAKRDLDQMPEVKKALPKVSPLNVDDEDELITIFKDII